MSSGDNVARPTDTGNPADTASPDMRASGAYRKRVARNLLYRFWVETSGRKAATRVAECVA